jgi:Xaa-Pro aminopeptidase
LTRAKRVTERLAEPELDALLVAAPANVRYLTGFTGSNALAVVGPALRRFLTDFRYVERARREVRDGFEVERGQRELLASLSEGWPPGPLRLGFEDDHMSVRRHARLREVLPARVELVAAGGLVEAARAVKEPGEVEAIRAAAALADAACRRLGEDGLVGRTEREVATWIELELRRLGAEAVAFAPIVAAGERGAAPHAEPEDVAIPRDALVTLDVGARVDGYCSDGTRTWATGEPAPELCDAYDVCLRAQRAARAALRPGLTGREADAVARDLIAGAGHGEHFGHSLGHGVGLDVHEDPRLSSSDERPLEAGHVVTVEPGIYLPARGGVRIEDLVVVREGGAEVLGTLPTDFTVVG